MPKETTTTTKGGKGKRTEHSPARSTTTSSPSLQQLKQSVENMPGIIKNAEDGRQHLVKKQWLLPEQHVTCAQLAAVLLTLVTSEGPRITTDRLSDNMANVIKSVAFLLEEVTVTQYAEKIASQIVLQSPTLNPSLSQPDNETAKHIKESIDTLNKTIQEQAERVQKTNEKLQEIHDLLPLVSAQTSTNANFSYRDVLINGTIGRPPAQLPPANIHKAKLQNRLNIEACQTLIEIQTRPEDNENAPTPTEPNLTGKLKTAVNKWLANSSVEDPPPPNSNIRSITQYRNNKLLFETNTREAAKWLKSNASRVLQPLIGHPIKVLGRLYPVIARFMPVQFQTNEEGVRDLENSANLPAASISHVTWLKNPERRTREQHCANVKIHCKNAEDANTLILGSGRISHMGSQLRIHKDIRTPGTCNRCQKYGHIAPDCKEESSTCARCGGDHRTRECTADGTKCTPCGSTDHQTNDERCPERIDRENATIDKKPEAFTPYYITDERWTWGLSDSDSSNRILNGEHSQQDYRPNAIDTRHKRSHTQNKGRPAQQRTLTSSGFLRKPFQSGANNTPLGRKTTHTTTPPTPSLPQQPPPDNQQASTSQNVQPTHSTNTQQ